MEKNSFYVLIYIEIFGSYRKIKIKFEIYFLT